MWVFHNNKQMNKIKKQLTKVRKVNKRVYIGMVIVYAIIGIATITAINSIGVYKSLKSAFEPKTIKIVNQKPPIKKKVVEARELVTCNDYAEQYEKSDLLKRIIKAESGNNAHAKNGVSSASGCFQFINGTWHGQGLLLWGDDYYNKNIWNAKDNVELANHLISKGQLSRWNESKHNWIK